MSTGRGCRSTSCSVWRGQGWGELNRRRCSRRPAAPFSKMAACSPTSETSASAYWLTKSAEPAASTQRYVAPVSSSSTLNTWRPEMCLEPFSQSYVFSKVPALWRRANMDVRSQLSLWYLILDTLIHPVPIQHSDQIRLQPIPGLIVTWSNKTKLC